MGIVSSASRPEVAPLIADLVSGNSRVHRFIRMRTTRWRTEARQEQAMEPRSLPISQQLTGQLTWALRYFLQERPETLQVRLLPEEEELFLPGSCWEAQKSGEIATHRLARVLRRERPGAHDDHADDSTPSSPTCPLPCATRRGPSVRATTRSAPGTG